MDNSDNSRCRFLKGKALRAELPKRMYRVGWNNLVILLLFVFVPGLRFYMWYLAWGLVMICDFFLRDYKTVIEDDVKHVYVGVPTPEIIMILTIEQVCIILAAYWYFGS
jgi:hypothetical protein